MRKLFLTTIYIAFVFLWLAGCSQKDDETVKVTINVPKYKNDTLTISATNMLSMDYDVLAKVKLDSGGRGTIEFKLEQPVFVSISGPKMGAELLLSPGEHLSILPQSPGAKWAITFAGDGAAVQEYLFDMHDIRRKLDTWNGKYSFRLDSTEFIKARDSLSRSYTRLITNLKNNPDVSDEQIQLLLKQNKMGLLFYEQNFTVSKDSIEIPLAIRNSIANMPVDTVLLGSRMFDYSIFASNFCGREYMMRFMMK
ncbi:hypothetical protein [Dyadobacter sp. MSC1_007]|jgi:hypothetical protein|uniref:hypothetical protein n=1 Tax=Dyadobacter sp. MSC1_007 TaxID=2909264 RepID=UPI0020308A4C|nr:hypothetical protein [Dyadobacter sp. MSC1_007]